MATFGCRSQPALRLVEIALEMVITPVKRTEREHRADMPVRRRLLEQRQRAAVLKLHRDAQRLLKPMLVANPFAERLTRSG